jgi:hypothetical protein
MVTITRIRVLMFCEGDLPLVEFVTANAAFAARLTVVL